MQILTISLKSIPFSSMKNKNFYKNISGKPIIQCDLKLFNVETFASTMDHCF